MADHAAATLYALMTLVVKLKEVPRDGWNRNPRKVANAEDVADHSYGTMMLAMVFPRLAPRLNVDQFVLMCMCGVHDIIETKTGDINIHIIKDPAERTMLRAEKARLEQIAINDIRQELGEEVGGFIFDLWMQYEAGKTVEAKIAHEFDKIEVIFQALWYYLHGHQVDPREFYANAHQTITTPELVLFLEQEIAPRLPV